MNDYFIVILEQIMSTELISKQLSLFDFTHYVKNAQEIIMPAISVKKFLTISTHR
jgi:hypothetical protein